MEDVKLQWSTWEQAEDEEYAPHHLQDLKIVARVAYKRPPSKPL